MTKQAKLDMVAMVVQNLVFLLSFPVTRALDDYMFSSSSVPSHYGAPLVADIVAPIVSFASRSAPFWALLAFGATMAAIIRYVTNGYPTTIFRMHTILFNGANLVVYAACGYDIYLEHGCLRTIEVNTVSSGERLISRRR